MSLPVPAGARVFMISSMAASAARATVSSSPSVSSSSDTELSGAAPAAFLSAVGWSADDAEAACVAAAVLDRRDM